MNRHIGADDYEKLMDKNKQTIDEILDRNPRIKHVIIAWGVNKSKLQGQYEDTIAGVLKIVNKHEKTILAMRFTSSNQPCIQEIGVERIVVINLNYMSG